MTETTSGTTNSRRQGMLLIGLLLVLAVIATLGVISSRHDAGSEAPPETVSPNPSSSAVAPPPTDPTAVTTAPPAPDAPTSTPSATAEETHSDDDGHDHANEPDYSNIELPPFPRSSDRKVSGGDAAAAKEALAAATKVWGGIDLTAPDLPASWLDRLRSTPEIGPGFVSASNREYFVLWGGAIQSNSSVKNARLVNAKPLWNLGSDSLWRVTIRRDVVDNAGNKALNTTDEVTWDFQVLQPEAGAFTVVNFRKPSADSKNPRTYNSPST